MHNKPGFTMMTSSNGNIFRVTGHLREEFTSPGEFPAQRPVKRSFDVFFDLRLNKRLSKQSWGWWLVAQGHPQWCQCNDFIFARYIKVGTKCVLKTMFRNAFSGMKIAIFWRKCCRGSFLGIQLTKGQHWLPELLVAYSTRSHYLNSTYSEASIC